MKSLINVKTSTILLTLFFMFENSQAQIFECNKIFSGNFLEQHNLDVIKATTILPLNRELTTYEIGKLEERFKLAYIFGKSISVQEADKFAQTSKISILTDYGISTSSITEANVDEAINLFIRVFLDKHPNRLTADELNLIHTKLKGFLIGSTQTSTMYIYDNKPVALIGLWPELFHPLLNSKVNHIGVVGYDSLAISKEQASAIKLDWQKIIFKSYQLANDHDIETTARVDLFNYSSQKLFLNFGFKPINLELTPK